MRTNQPSRRIPTRAGGLLAMRSDYQLWYHSHHFSLRFFDRYCLVSSMKKTLYSLSKLFGGRKPKDPQAAESAKSREATNEPKDTPIAANLGPPPPTIVISPPPTDVEHPKDIREATIPSV